MEEKVCCVFGHRKIEYSKELENEIYKTAEKLIVDENVKTFLFGSKSEFDSLCLKVITDLKEKFTYIKRIYVRAEFPYIDEGYKDYLLKSYDETYFPEKILNAGSASYVERNQEMINKSDFCIVYYDENYLPPKKYKSKRDLTPCQPKSGSGIDYSYAVKKKKTIINLYKKITPTVK